MTTHRFSRTTLQATPWKNGGGITREIVSSPRGAGLDSFTWRVSIAEVSADGPFSVYAGVDRVIVLLAGNGVVLRDADGRAVRRLDEPFAPFAFSGDERITASLIGGPSSDFNVMTRRGVARADVSVVRSGETLAASRAGVLFAARGRWTVRAARPSDANDAAGPELSFETDDGCWWDDESVAWRLEPSSSDAVLLAVHIHPTPDSR